MKKTDNNKPDKLAALDAAIEAERRTIAKLQMKAQQAREAERTAEEQQGRLAYRGLAEGESTAQAALSEAEELLGKTQARARSADIALKASQEKLEELQRERQQLVIELAKAAYAAEACELIRNDAESLEAALALMTTARDDIRNRLRKMEQLALDGGIDTARVHSRVRESLRHAIETRAQFESIWMSRANREIFKQPVSALLQSVLKSLIPEIEEDERKVKSA